MSTPTDAPPSEGDEAAPALAVEEVPTAVVEPEGDAEHGAANADGTADAADAADTDDL